MKRVVFLQCTLGILFLAAVSAIGRHFQLEFGNPLYQFMSVLYLCIPGGVAIFFARREGLSLPLGHKKPAVTGLALFLPLLLLFFSLVFTFVFSLNNLDDAYMLAPMHGLTVKQRVLQFLTFSSSLALLTLCYGLTLQLAIAVGEEVMWRGYCLEHLKEVPFFKKAVLLGVLSGLWYVPLTILFGMMHPEDPVLGPLWVILLSLLLSPILLFLRLSSGSLVAPVLFHAFFYAASSLLPYIVNDPNYLMGGMTGVAGFIALIALNVLLVPFYRKIKQPHISVGDNP